MQSWRLETFDLMVEIVLPGRPMSYRGWARALRETVPTFDVGQDLGRKERAVIIAFVDDLELEIALELQNGGQAEKYRVAGQLMSHPEAGESR